MNSLDILLDIHRSFGYFKNDFDMKNKNKNHKIFYAMDNDLYSFSLYPFEDKIKYADLFREKHTNKKVLQTRAKHLALAIKYLSDRGSLYILPSHRLEYKKTLFYFYNKIYNMKTDIDNKDLELQIVNIQKHIGLLIKLFKNNPDKFKDKLTELAPLIFQLIHFQSKYDFLISQLKFFKTKDKINSFDKLLDNKEENLIFTNKTKLDIEDNIVSNMLNQKSELSLHNDVQAFKTIIAFNQKYENEKKLILLTGDNSMLKTYEAYEDAVGDDEKGLIRHATYLIPFISEPDSKLYSKSNEKMLESIDILFDDLINSISKDSNNNNLPYLSSNVAEDLKKILSTRYIQNSKMDGEEFNFLKALYNKARFKEYINNVYNVFLEDIKSSLSLSYAANEILSMSDELENIKYFHRYPFVLCLKDNEEQRLFTKFLSYLTKENKINKILVEMDDKLPLHTVYLVTAIVLVYVDKKKEAEEYIKLARHEISNKPKEIYIKRELELLELFLKRTSITIDTYNDTNKSFITFTSSKSGISKGQLFRAEVGKCALDLAYCYIQYFEKTIPLTTSINNIYENFISLHKEKNSVLADRPFIRERASIQIYINIASLYIYTKYFLKHESYQEVHGFILEHIQKYKKLFFDNRDIGIRNILLAFLLYDFEEISYNKTFEVLTSLKSCNNLLDYENKRLKFLLDIVTKSKKSGISKKRI